MSAYSKFISFFLLAVFFRVLVPDSLVLALHRHTHTQEVKLNHPAAKHQLGEKHIHCPVEHLFDSSFYHLPPAVTWPAIQTPPKTHLQDFSSIWKFTFPNSICLRGPPSLPAFLA
ncbi:hypothetical protein AAE02nite_04640 [Adhaeribacter aerolatus]|uniref:Uncharacterized protein n=1 Tax=Adhaeribacter aerolatus TaxID=670289 RepID=A0A512ASZ0_9BACT|nr:hypothetical protein [Adhaeribacter aerolatus]GEO02800.1 hypothetical protein AAE02nite_04640 [Adhaeribacter aerolatus]